MKIVPLKEPNHPMEPGNHLVLGRIMPRSCPCKGLSKSTLLEFEVFGPAAFH